LPIQQSKKILVAPLDWGLGHTTRCVPVIRGLLAAGHQPLIAGNKAQITFLKALFPDLPACHLAGYDVHYAHSGSWLLPKLLGQIPRIGHVIRKEHQWLRRIVAEKSLDAVISDNRYGLYLPDIPSIIMTHQVQPLSGMGRWADRVALHGHRYALAHFDACWIPDISGRNNLSGILGHPDGRGLGNDFKYMGLLTQFDEIPPRLMGENHLLVLLSGPEPQRSLLSDRLWQALKHYDGRVVFVEGSNAAPPKAKVPAHIQYHRRLTTSELLPCIAGASLVICRSGYSSLMDLQRLGKKAILIPTPGQTEQEYLAKRLHACSVYMMQTQHRFHLQEAISQARSFPFLPLSQPADFNRHASVIAEWLGGF
jgi:UDP:flavonoid glycosyltransferase YjiC (YdhE family)